MTISSPKHVNTMYSNDNTLDVTLSQNIMFDQRVCRGSTYARRKLSPTEQRDFTKQGNSKKRQSWRRSNKVGGEGRQHDEGVLKRSETPPPVAGRLHSHSQTENFLEVLTDKVEEIDNCAQTDPIMDRPDSPLFVPVASGESKSTQIEQGDLFNFDLEVKPIVSVLVGKTLDHSMMEVLEEHELKELHRHQRQFEQLRSIEIAETQRLEARETRIFDEKERRKKQELERVEKQKELALKISSRNAAKQYLASLQTDALNELDHNGHFADVLAEEIETNFVPWLLECVVQRVDEQRIAQQLTTACIEDAMVAGVDNSHHKINETLTALREEKLRIRQQEEAAIALARAEEEQQRLAESEAAETAEDASE